jgi:hypothetical protein
MHTVLDPFAEHCEEASRDIVLYHVEPQGTDDGPEGLISWLVAVAQAHSLSPRVLMKHMIEQSAAHRDLWSGTTFFDRDCVTINGHGKYARMAVSLLAGHSQVAFKSMTLLELTELFPHNGEGMLARYPKWCSDCLCDQARLGKRSHLKLAWSLEHYKVCHVHKVPLSERCPACGSMQSFFPIYPSVVHCNSCDRSLLASPPEIEPSQSSAPNQFELWCANSLADLVGRRAELGAHGRMVAFRRNVADIVRRLSPGNKKGLCESVGLQAYALNGWLNKDERPSMSVLLRFCFGVSTEVADMFVPDAANRVSEPKVVTCVLDERCARPMLGFEQRKHMERLLEVIVNDMTDCRPLGLVATQLGLRRSAMKYWFRQQCREIVKKNRSFESRRQEVRYRGDHELLHAIVQSLRAKEVNPSRRRVDAELRKNGLALARPDLFLAFEKLRGFGRAG